MTQLHLAETEKYAHVTFFFNGGRNESFPGETDLLIPSHKVATYDLDPAMSATEILEKLISEAPKYDFTVVNFANGDMVGHTGKIDAAIRAVETIDHTLEQILRLAENNEINLFISADHGNCEEMGSPDAPKTAHTLNPVPFWFFRKGIAQPLQNGTIADIAPTILHAMGIEQPGEMTGKVLL
jgi:2,3-bisphosphoglycerate-independent phosphoglycerate mutase